MAVPARGRASTPARAAADPPESTVVINRPFSEMMPARGRGNAHRTRGCGEMPPGPGIPGGATRAVQPAPSTSSVPPGCHRGF